MRNRYVMVLGTYGRWEYAWTLAVIPLSIFITVVSSRVDGEENFLFGPGCGDGLDAAARSAQCFKIYRKWRFRAIVLVVSGAGLTTAAYRSCAGSVAHDGTSTETRA